MIAMKDDWSFNEYKHLTVSCQLRQRNEPEEVIIE